MLSDHSFRSVVFGTDFIDQRHKFTSCIVNLIQENAKMMEASTRLQVTSARQAREHSSPDWRMFETANKAILEISGEISKTLFQREGKNNNGMVHALAGMATITIPRSFFTVTY